MYNIILLSLLINLSFSCSPTPRWEPSTTQEQVKHAGAVVIGKVTTVETNNTNYISTITLEETVFYKGCGPKQITVTGFTDSAACGVDVPSKNSEIVVYVCRDKDKGIWKLNEINIHAGAAVVNTTVIEQLKEYTENEDSCGECGLMYADCTKPETS